jgi:predicted nucleic acid-binding protein
VTLFIDTSVVMYAAGEEHPFRSPCVAVLDRISSGSVAAVTSSEVIQEIVHRYLSVRRPDMAIRVAELSMDLFAPVVPITHALMRRVPDLMARYPDLQARDLVHVATCIHEGIIEIVSTDRGFDQVAEIRRIDPAVFAA